jgi:thioredoxin 1
MSTNVAAIRSTDFEQEVVKSDKLVIADFWAEWCGPCKMLMPAVEEIAQIYANEVKVAKVNSDENKRVSEQFNVRGLPTLIVLRDGVEQERILGVTSKTRIAAVLDKYLEA